MSSTRRRRAEARRRAHSGGGLGAVPVAEARTEAVAPAVPAAPQAPAAAALPWARADLVLLCGAILFALALYCSRLAVPAAPLGDESLHVYTASQLAKGDHDAYWYTESVGGRVVIAKYEWMHPGLGKLIAQAGIHLFGDGPVGWRAFSAAFGAAGVGLLYLLGRLMFNRKVAAIAAALLIMDGLWFVQSRVDIDEIFVSVFLLLAYLFFFLALRAPAARSLPYVWLTGAALGLALASKWSAAPSLGLLAFVLALREGRRGLAHRGREGRAALARPAIIWLGAFVALPAGIYLASYFQFFTMGHTFAQLLDLQKHMYLWYRDLDQTGSYYSSPWWAWPLLLRSVPYYNSSVAAHNIALVLAMGNPLLWWSFLPALGFVAYRWCRLRLDARTAAPAPRPGPLAAAFGWLESHGERLGLAIVLAGFLGQWLANTVSSGDAFIYQMLAVVPFGCLAVAYCLAGVRLPRVAVGGYLLAILAAFVFFYPVWAAWPLSGPQLHRRFRLSGWDPFRIVRAPRPRIRAQALPATFALGDGVLLEAAAPPERLNRLTLYAPNGTICPVPANKVQSTGTMLAALVTPSDCAGVTGWWTGVFDFPDNTAVVRFDAVPRPQTGP